MRGDIIVEANGTAVDAKTRAQDWLKDLKPGDKLKRTVDMSTMPGIIWLAHDDKAQLISDYNTIRSLEKDLYILS